MPRHCTRNLLIALGLALVSWVIPCAMGADHPPLIPFVLPWDDDAPTVTDVRRWLPDEAPAGKNGPVVVRDGHLFSGAKRLRLVGVNVCFGANFPEHEDARKVAARMAKFGINAVRFHHMDNQTAPSGIWSRDRKTLDPKQIDRLDFFFAELKRNGIYADLNLHVSRDYPDRPRWDRMPSYFKGVDNFDPDMIAFQKEYAKALLTHRNPYTGLRYADDPGVAIVEINNENALTHEWFSGQLDAMPDSYGRLLAERWNAWLTDRYKDDATLRRIWEVRSTPLFSEMIANGRFTRMMESWNLERHEGAEATANVIVVGPSRAALMIDVPHAAKQAWHVQVNQRGIQVRSNWPYTISFLARAEKPRTMNVNVMQSHEPWRQLWSTEVDLTPEFRRFNLVLQSAEDERFARLGFSGLGSQPGRIEIAEVSMKPGGDLGIEAGESLGKIAWFRKREFSRRTPEAQRDWLRFVSQLELEYWTGLARYLKEDLGVKAPLVGTQMNWSPPAVQSHLDVIDSHAYWQHPHFPGRPWDPSNWTINNIPMAGRPDGGTLPSLGLSRIAGMPFLCTEYNHAAPNEFSAETAPLIFGYAALQDWDGVFLFAYSHRSGRSWDTGHFGSFFDIDQHPAKLANLPAAALAFRRGDLASRPPIVERVSPELFLERLRGRGPWGILGNDTRAFSTTRSEALTQAVAREITEDLPRTVNLDGRQATRVTPPSTGWSWSSRNGHGVAVLDTPRSKFIATSEVPNTYELSGVTLETQPNRLGWAVITLSALDGPDMTSPGRLLVSAIGLVENTGMHWTDASRQSIGRNWGERPSLVEGISLSLRLGVPASRVRAWPLDERGSRRAHPIRVESVSDGARIPLGPHARTLWYEVEITP